MIFYCCDYYSVLIAVKVAKIENKSKHPPPQNADAVTFTPEPAYGHRTHNVYMMTHTVAYFFFLGGEFTKITFLAAGTKSCTRRHKGNVAAGAKLWCSRPQGPLMGKTQGGGAQNMPATRLTAAVKRCTSSSVL